jgi:hypothetical protein
MKHLVVAAFQYLFLGSLLFAQTLPQVWVDNNEATDGSIESYAITSHGTGCSLSGNLSISAPPAGGTQATGTYTCASGSLSSVTITNPGRGYTSNPTVKFGNTTNSPCPGCAVSLTVNTPPAYEFALGSSTWISGPPPSYCAFSLPYAATASGKQSAINAMEACRTAGISHSTALGIILDVPPGTYTSATGVVIPQTSSTLASTFLIIRSTMDSTLASKPEPVCAGGIQDNISESTNIGLINSDCQAGAGGGTFGYQLGNTVTAIPSGPFTLANGTPTNSSNYNYLQYMYQDECTGSTCLPFRLCSPNLNPPNQCGSGIGPDHWEFEDGAAALAPGNTTDNDLINTGVTVGATSLTQFATHIHVRRYWAHGDWTTLTAGANSVAAGFDLSGCYYCSVVGSQVSQALRPGAEGHSISAQGFQLKMDNDWLEGSSSGIFAGGFGSPPSMRGYVPFEDVQIGRVRNTFPYAWLGVTNPSCYNPDGTIPPGNPYWGCNGTKGGGYSIVRKNAEEFKEGERVLIYGFIAENVDNSGGQRGIISGFNVRNTSGGGPVPQNYQATINDVTVQNSIFRNSCEGMGIDGRSASASGDGGGVGYPMARVTLSNILQYNVSDSNFGSGSGTGACPSGLQVGMGMSNGGGGQSWQGDITCNQTAGTCQFTGVASVDAGVTVNASSGASGGDTTYTVVGSIAAANATVCGSSPGNYVFVSGFTHSGNNNTTTGFQCVSSTATTLVLANSSGVAETITTPRTNNANPVVSNTAALGFQVMDMYAGDPVGISNCTTSGLNPITENWGSGYYWPTQVQAHVTANGAPAIWAGNFSLTGLTVTYSWSVAQGNTGQSDNSGTCVLTNGEGGPENFTLNHMTFITDTTETLGAGPSNSGGVQFSLLNAFENDIMLSGAGAKCGSVNCAGWYNEAQGEGNATEIFDYDTSTLTAAYMVWPGRTASLYYEYPNNPNYPDPACSSSTAGWQPDAGGSNPPIGGCNPPNSMYFPATSCDVDFVESCSGSVPLTLSDYHNYALSPSSPYTTLGYQGTAMGAMIPSIDAAQTTTLYVCQTSCGSLGPYSD